MSSESWIRGVAIIQNTTIARNIAELGTHDLSGGYISFGGNLIGDSTGGWGFRDGINGDQVGDSANPLPPILNLTVDTLSDEFYHNFSLGELSLREAISLISPRGTISFAPELKGVIELSLGELTLNKSVMIDGSSAQDLTIIDSENATVFSIGSDTTVHLDGLTIANKSSESQQVAINLNPGAELIVSEVILKDSTLSNLMGSSDTFNNNSERKSSRHHLASQSGQYFPIVQRGENNPSAQKG